MHTTSCLWVKYRVICILLTGFQLSNMSSGTLAASVSLRVCIRAHRINIRVSMSGYPVEAYVRLRAACPDATVVVERSTRDPEPAWPDGFELERQKTYGETTLYWVAATSP